MPSGCGVADQSILTSGDPDLALFTNLGAINYWSATTYAPSPGGAWQFQFANGRQATSGKPAALRGWAVRDGDIGAVPLPATWVIALPACLMLARCRRRKSGPT